MHISVFAVNDDSPRSDETGRVAEVVFSIRILMYVLLVNVSEHTNLARSPHTCLLKQHDVLFFLFLKGLTVFPAGKGILAYLDPSTWKFESPRPPSPNPD